MRSIWSINDIQKKDKREPFPEHISAAVIGGGMAGILCAWFLMESGVDTVVLEAAGRRKGPRLRSHPSMD